MRTTTSRRLRDVNQSSSLQAPTPPQSHRCAAPPQVCSTSTGAWPKSCKSVNQDVNQRRHHKHFSHWMMACLKQIKTTVLTCLRQFSGCGLTAAAQHVITANNNIILLLTPSAVGCGLLGNLSASRYDFNRCAARKDLISDKEPESRLTGIWQSGGSDYMLDPTCTAKSYNKMLAEDHHLNVSIIWSWSSVLWHRPRCDWINSTVTERNQNTCVSVRHRFNRWN